MSRPPFFLLLTLWNLKPRKSTLLPVESSRRCVFSSFRRSPNRCVYCCNKPMPVSRFFCARINISSAYDKMDRSFTYVTESFPLERLINRIQINVRQQRTNNSTLRCASLTLSVLVFFDISTTQPLLNHMSTRASLIRRATSSISLPWSTVSKYCSRSTSYTCSHPQFRYLYISRTASCALFPALKP